MKKAVKTLFIFTMSLGLAATVSMTAQAHHGNSHSGGGHCRNSDYYYCGGHEAHLHTDGCPYTNTSANNASVTTKKSSNNSSPYSASLVKKVQKALNKEGYDCGAADGVFGKKTKACLLQYQEDNKLDENGTINKEVKSALGIV